MKQLLYYTDLICQKIDLHADAFVMRLEALQKGDIGKADFIEKMMLNQLNEQIIYLSNKAINLIRKDKKNG